MTEITKNQCVDRGAVNRDEAENLKSLIQRRRIWLENPKNKMKGTYSAVVRDTMELEEELKMIETNIIKA